MRQWREDWVNGKIRIIRDRIIKEEHYSLYYPELTILSCSIISAFAAELWPGMGSDHVRFVETLAKYADPSTNTKTISIPLLVDYLASNDHNGEAALIGKEFLAIGNDLVIHGEDYDKTEGEVLELISVPLRVVRECSYANILYKHFRNPYIHEYRPGTFGESWKMTDEDANVSYVNFIDPPYRRIHFHLNWFTGILNSLGRAIDKLPSVPLKEPEAWWIKLSKYQ